MAILQRIIYGSNHFRLAMTIPLKVSGWVNYSETLKAVLQSTIYGKNHFRLAMTIPVKVNR